MLNELKTCTGGGLRRLGLRKSESQNALSIFSKHKNAFTLAEVLITITVIGVVAVITFPIIVNKYQERINSQRQANIVYKVTQATNLMKANEQLGNFSSTMDFVNVLKTHLTIQKICDSEHIAECWPTQKVRAANGIKYDVSKFTKRKDLGFDDAYGNNPNVGIVLSDGASLIMTYNPANGGISMGDELAAKSISLPVGNGIKEFLEYTTNTTSGIAFVMDVNGGKGPNSETIDEKYYDIRNLNGARFNFCGGIRNNNKCYTHIVSPTPYNCSEDTSNTYCSQQSANGGINTSYTTDYWAGASNDCAALGGHLPTVSELLSICENSSLRQSINLGNFGTPLWSSELRTNFAGDAQSVNFGTCEIINYYGRRNSYPQALCIGN